MPDATKRPGEMPASPAGVLSARAPQPTTPASPASGGGSPAVEVSLLHRFCLRSGGVEVDLPTSAQRLVAYLALRRGPVNRLLVSGTLWTTSTEEKAAASLRTALWRAGNSGCPLVATRGTMLAIQDAVSVDLQEIERCARGVLRPAPGETARACVLAAPLLTAGDILPDWFDDWVLLARERFRQLRLQALESLARLELATGEHGQAIETATIAMECEPLRESAHRLLIEIHLDQGNCVEARRQYALCSRLLLQQLRVQPSPALAALAVRGGFADARL